jgi:hypothetical protein
MKVLLFRPEISVVCEKLELSVDRRAARWEFGTGKGNSPVVLQLYSSGVEFILAAGGSSAAPTPTSLTNHSA